MKINTLPGGNIKKRPEVLYSGVIACFVFSLFAGMIIFVMADSLWGADTAVSETPKENGASVILSDISIVDNAVKVRVSGPIKYTLYKPANAFQCTVEIEGASVGRFSDKIISTSRGITEVVPVQINVPSLSARLNIFLQSPAEVKTEIVGDTLIISLEKTAGARTEAAEPAPVGVADSAPAPAAKEGSAREITELFVEGKSAKQSAEEEREPAAAGQIPVGREGAAREITEIFFDRDKDLVELIIKADGKMREPAVYQLDGTVMIDIAGVMFKGSVPPKMIPPVRDIKVKSESDRLRIVITTQAGARPDFYVLEDELLVDFAPSGAAAKKGITERGPLVQDKIVDGSKVISLDFQDADIVPILRLLGDVSGYNIVVHPDVKGKITMKLLNVPWTQALEIVIKTFNLEKVVEGNIIRIATVKAFQEEKKSTAENKELFGKAEDIVTKVFTVNNANVDKLKESIDKGKILSPRGTVSTDLRTRALIVKDIQSTIDEVQRLITALDKPTRQVMIEARIVEMTATYAQSLGVEWGMTGKAKGMLGKNDQFSTQGSQGSSVPGGLSAGTGLFNLPAATSATPLTSAITFGYLTADKTLGLDIRLSAVETNGQVKVIASPKIMTLDNTEAMIKQGKKIPVTTQQVTGGVITFSTAYIDAMLKLTVTPQISPDGAIVMKLELIKEEPNYTITDNQGNPQIDTRQASTQVVLNDGETVVIGGIINNSDSKTNNVVPGISKIPLIGELFKQRTKETSNFELLIFLTPRLLQ
jgi:type IV pilus assembly protein PilQ